MHRLALTLLGGFGVTVDGQEVPATAWSRRQPTHLVKVLALAPRHELHREQVMDALWPGVDPDLAAPRLHKAAHYARRALGLPDAVVLAGDTVRLCAGAAVDVDALAFEAGARAALAAGDASDAGRAADAYPGDLLPADPYEPWAEGPRERLRLLHRDLLRLAGRWADLAAADPTDERAHLELARAAATSGDDAAALRWLERLEQAMRRELGTAPGQAVAALRRTLLGRLPAPSDPPPGARLTPAGRDAEMRRIERLLAEVRGGVGQVLFVSGAPGMGTTSVLHALEARARARGLAVGSGVAARTAGAWPYAPVLEALSDLCRRDPRLLAGLGGPARAELERVLAGAELAWDGATSHQRLYVAAAELVTLAAGDRGAVLVVDDADESDEATLRLLHYLARATATARVLIAVGHRPAPGAPSPGSVPRSWPGTTRARSSCGRSTGRPRSGWSARTSTTRRWSRRSATPPTVCPSRSWRPLGRRRAATQSRGTPPSCRPPRTPSSTRWRPARCSAPPSTPTSWPRRRTSPRPRPRRR